MKGVAYFMADLRRAIDLPLALDFMTITRYGPHTRGSGPGAPLARPGPAHRRVRRPAGGGCD